VDHDDIEQINVIIGNNQRKDEEDKQQYDRPEENHPALEELNVLVVVTFHIHDSTSTGIVFSAVYSPANNLSERCQELFPVVFRLDFGSATPLYVSPMPNGSNVSSNPNKTFENLLFTVTQANPGSESGTGAGVQKVLKRLDTGFRRYDDLPSFGRFSKVSEREP
jgi:hypothetical protein